MSDDMRSEIIDALMATSGLSEGVAADAIMSVFRNWQSQQAQGEARKPLGAAHNGLALMDRIECDYQFKCEAGPIGNCSDWFELRASFEEIATYISKFPIPASAPKGWKLVPVEATEDMKAVYADTSIAPISTLSERGYKEMINSVPSFNTKINRKTMSMCISADYMRGWNDCRESVLANAPADQK